MKIADLIKVVLSLLSIFGLIWATVMEFPNFSNTIGIMSVLWKGGLLWIPLCLVAASIIATLGGFPWYNGLLFGLLFGVLTFPLFSSLFNRLGQEENIYSERTVFLGVDARIKDRGLRKVGPIQEPDEYHIFFGEEEDPLKLIVEPSSFWTDIEPGDSVSVHWLPGRLGGKIFQGVKYGEREFRSM